MKRGGWVPSITLYFYFPFTPMLDGTHLPFSPSQSPPKPLFAVYLLCRTHIASVNTYVTVMHTGKVERKRPIPPSSSSPLPYLRFSWFFFFFFFFFNEWHGMT
ncbi:hypothetical protein F4810DRAFT_140152 [Camillea tinctor]|nr:hypothetical protein F4810DRAFT_140152 [Camillea tinctor]